MLGDSISAELVIGADIFFKLGVRYVTNCGKKS